MTETTVKMDEQAVDDIKQQATAQSKAEPTGAGKKIILVDPTGDSASICMLLELIGYRNFVNLDDLGTDAYDKAVELVTENPDEYGLIITEPIGHPSEIFKGIERLSGAKMLTQLKSAGSNVPVIIYSTMMHDATVADFVKLGYPIVIDKWDFTDLEEWGNLLHNLLR